MHEQLPKKDAAVNKQPKPSTNVPVINILYIFGDSVYVVVPS